ADRLYYHVLRKGLYEAERRLGNSVLVEVGLAYEPRLLGVGDLEDVDVDGFVVVGRDEVRAIARVPGKRAVVLVRIVRRVAQAVRCEVAEMLGQLGGLERIRDVPEREPGFEILAAALVVHHKHIAAEGAGRQSQRLHSLANQRVL